MLVELYIQLLTSNIVLLDRRELTRGNFKHNQIGLLYLSKEKNHEGQSKQARDCKISV